MTTRKFDYRRWEIPIAALCIIAVMLISLFAVNWQISRQISGLKNEIALRDQELAGLQEQIDSLSERVARLQWQMDFVYVLKASEYEFTFTWGPDTQKIVEGTFRLEVSLKLVGETLLITVKANDDEYNGWDYLGLAFDTNDNGFIDQGDKSYGLFADNSTLPSALGPHGYLIFADIMATRGPHNCTFDPDTGYTFEMQLSSPLKEGCNPLHICFDDQAVYDAWVFVRFVFLIETEG